MVHDPLIIIVKIPRYYYFGEFFFKGADAIDNDFSKNV